MSEDNERLAAENRALVAELRRCKSGKQHPIVVIAMSIWEDSYCFAI